jgi:hypothetical protein
MIDYQILPGGNSEILTNYEFGLDYLSHKYLEDEAYIVGGFNMLQ